MTRTRKFSTTADEAGRRLDVVVARRLDRSRSSSAQLIKDGHVRVDGHIAKPSAIVESHTKVEVNLPPAREAAIPAQDLPLRIVHDEESFCVVDKPAGMATHPARGNQDGTLVNALVAKLGKLPAINGVRRPGIVHRLDKDTSGLLVVAKTEQAMLALTKAMAARRIKRVYAAVVSGVPRHERGEIDAPLGRDPRDRTKFTVREDGRRAVTHYTVQEKFRDAALLRLELETGRTHQIRVHCAAIGHPIVGDGVYGESGNTFGMQRQALHAAELSFDHPVTGKPQHFISPWPEDFSSLVRRLRLQVEP